VRAKVGEEEETVADSELEEMSSKLDSYMAEKISSVGVNEQRTDYTMDGNATLVYGSAIAVGGVSGGLPPPRAPRHDGLRGSGRNSRSTSSN